MRGNERRVAVALAVVCVAVVVAFAVGRSSGPQAVSAGTGAAANTHAPAWSRARELLRGGEEAQEAAAAAEQYAERAYPATDVSWEQTQAAMQAATRAATRSPKIAKKWDPVGPFGIDVDRLGTQTYQRGTNWSGRITTMAVDAKCGRAPGGACKLYVGAAGGGVWRSTHALAGDPNWKYVSDDIPSNAVGSILIDPNDKTGKTIYVGTGEANGSGDSEAGVGLYKSTDGGNNWSLVAGSTPVAAGRSIPGLAVDPTNPNHILIGTGTGFVGAGGNGGSLTPPGVAAIGIYESTDGGATFTLSRLGTSHEIRFDPSTPGVVYATGTGTGGGLLRSTAGGAAGTWQQIFAGTRTRYSFSAVKLPNGKTRIYLSDANGGGQSGQAYRVDDAQQPAATLTASNNAAWVRLSSPIDGTPGFASWGYCDGQCGYDMFISSPADNPDMVVLGGLMVYDELPPYPSNANAGTDRSSGRAVLLSTDAGATWTDQTGDAQIPGESMHPDQHAIAFVPGDPDTMFVGSDGGVIRTNGRYADISSQCDSRGLSPLFLQDCKMWLKRVPELLIPINWGLGTLQFQSIAVNPKNPAGEALGGTQDNGSLSFLGGDKWRLGLTGDGGDAGFDPVDPNRRFHSYFSGWLDINYEGDNPPTWLWVADPMFFAGGFRFYSPMVMDPVREKTIFVGGTRVWRTQDLGGDRAFLEQHCNTTFENGKGDLITTGACGDFAPIGPTATLGSTTFGTTKAGGNLAAIGRGLDDGTLWTATQNGRVFVSKNSNDAAASVTYTRIDTAAQPQRFPSSTTVDTTNPNHAIVSFSGYNSTTPTTPGHVFDVVFDPATGTAAWKDISYDLGDMPVSDTAYDAVTGDVYASTDFGVYRLAAGTTTWTTAAEGLPKVAVYSLTLADGEKFGERLLWAATHGRSAYRLEIR
jgi:hypothetical protein